MTRFVVSMTLGLLLWSLASVASAGGFAVTTLDSVPPTVVAGETYRIGFMLRQHGIAPVPNAKPAIVITRGTLHLEFAARAEGDVGHYVADVTFPSDGDWTWSVDQSPFPTPQALGRLSVSAPAVLVRPRPPAELAFLGIVLLGLAAASVGVVGYVRRAPRPRP